MGAGWVKSPGGTPLANAVTASEGRRGKAEVASGFLDFNSNEQNVSKRAEKRLFTCDARGRKRGLEGKVMEVCSFGYISHGYYGDMLLFSVAGPESRIILSLPKLFAKHLPARLPTIDCIREAVLFVLCSISYLDVVAGIRDAILPVHSA